MRSVDGDTPPRESTGQKAPRSPLVARTVAAWAFLGAGAPAAVVALAIQALRLPIPIAPVAIAVAAIGAAVAGWLAVRRMARRLDAVARFMEQRVSATSSIARRETEATQRERKLASDLATKTDELEQRLRERALLFDVLRESVSSHDLGSVLRTLAERLGPGLRFREVAVLLRERDDRLAIRAAWGFADPDKLLGRTLALGEGLTGEAAAKGEPIIVDDVASAPEYLAFWGEAPRTGSFMTVPIRFADELIGMLALTRPPTEPLTELELRYVQALADQVALAIRNAQLFAELENSASHDPLTSLPNRRLFEERYERELAEARRYEQPLALLAIDIDHFKLLNDRCGHPAGDAALVAIARALERGVRATDTVARTGGEEFVVLLSRADAAEASKVAQKLRQEIAEIDLPSAAGQPLGHLSISIGVAALGKADDASSLLARADAALYDAKRLGRDRVSTLPPPPDEPILG